MNGRRRDALTLLAGMAVVGCGKQNRPRTLRIAMSAIENEADRTARYVPLRMYLERKLAVQVEIRTAADYAGVIEAVRAGHVDVAYVGAAAYAQAWQVTNGNVLPLAASLNEAGQAGYYSVIEVAAGTAYRNVTDLRGRIIAFADPNSTSGFLAPSYFLRAEGVDPDTFFSKTVFAGTHEATILAVVRGTADAGATWAYGDALTNSARMAGKGMIPRGSTRTVWRSPLIPSSAWVVRVDMPASERLLLQQAITSCAAEDPAGFAIVGSGRESGYAATTHGHYETVIAMLRANLDRRKAFTP